MSRGQVPAYFYRHSTRMYFIKVKQRGPTPPFLFRGLVLYDIFTTVITYCLNDACKIAIFCSYPASLIYSLLFSRANNILPIIQSKKEVKDQQSIQVPHLTQNTNGKVTNHNETNESQEVSPFPSGDLKALINRRLTRTKA